MTNDPDPNDAEQDAAWLAYADAEQEKNWLAEFEARAEDLADRFEAFINDPRSTR